MNEFHCAKLFLSTNRFESHGRRQTGSDQEETGLSTQRKKGEIEGQTGSNDVPAYSMISVIAGGSGLVSAGATFFAIFNKEDMIPALVVSLLALCASLIAGVVAIKTIENAKVRRVENDANRKLLRNQSQEST